ncbi:MAG: hypothetical protein ACQEXV_12150 [Bacillota bacterium]
MLVQSVFQKEEIEQLVRKLNYEETVRQFSAFELLHYWMQAAFE